MSKSEARGQRRAVTIVVVLLLVLLGAGVSLWMGGGAGGRTSDEARPDAAPGKARASKRSVGQPKEPKAPQEASQQPAEGQAALTMAAVGDRLIAARAGDVVVWKGQVDSAMYQAIDRAQAQNVTTDWAWLEKTRRQRLEMLLSDALLEKHLKARQVRVSQAEVEASLAAWVDARFGSEEGFERHLKRIGKAREDMLEEHRQTLALQRVLAKQGRLEPNDEEIREVYERHKHLFRAPARRRVDMLVVSVGARAEAEDVEAAKGVAAEVQTQLSAGVPPSEVAQATGARLVYANKAVTRGFLPPQVERQLAGASDGQVLPPIRSGQGFHVTRLVARHDAGVMPLEEVEESVRRKARAQLLTTRRRQLIKELVSGDGVERPDGRWSRRLQRRVHLFVQGARARPAPDTSEGEEE